MKGPMRSYYDEEGDFLEISVGEPTECYAEEVEPGIFIRFDKKNNQVKSIGVLDFKQRARTLQEIILNLPLKIDFEAM
ncbi:DUF2283 domain-containing protein [Candidatus Pacearchaeota archaeon]|nr:hypothetical protein [uncultured archaeon]AQS31894.1 hypothetical protein [uncultured archaeon]MBS3088592.1 DUF2283 domain-containing protein [Candidatus Pacearchaeota archaeon]